MIDSSSPSIPPSICSPKGSSLTNFLSLPLEGLLKKIYWVGLSILNLAFGLISTVFYVLKGRVSSTPPPSQEAITKKLIKLESTRKKASEKEVERVKISISEESGEKVLGLTIDACKRLEGLSQDERTTIREINFTNEQALIEIAKLVAQRPTEILIAQMCPELLSRFFDNYHITSEQARIEIAKLVAQRSPESLSQFIENYHITDELALIEIAKLAAQKPEVRISEFIQNYHITNEQARIEIAKLIAQQPLGGAISASIQNYHITNEQARIEIAKLAAQNCPGSLSRFFENYHITDEQVRIEIAKLVAPQSGWISEFIQNYHITNEQARIEIARFAVQNDPEMLSEFIENYHITDEQARIEIAKLVAQRSPESLSQFIENYHITDELALIEIAKLVAQRSPESLSQFIENYHITDEQARIEIAKLVAQRSPESLSQFIENYHITNEQARVEFAKFAVRQNPVQFSRLITNYHIADEQARIELAKSVAQQNGAEIGKHIRNYHITHERDRLEILKLAVRQNLDLLDECLNGQSTIMRNFELSSQTLPIMDIISNLSEEGLASVFTDLDKFNLKLPENPQKVREGVKWLLYTCLQLIDSTSQFPEDPTFLAKIFKHPDSKMRYQLVNAALDIFNDPSKTAAYNAFVEDKEYLKLPALLLFQKEVLPICQILKEPLMKIKVFLKDGAFLKNFLNVVDLLMSIPQLSQQEAIFLIRQTLILPEEEKQIKDIQAKLTRKGITREEELALKKESDQIWEQIKTNLRNRQLTIQSIIECRRVDKLKLAIPSEFSSIKERPIRSGPKSSFNLYRILQTILNESLEIKGIENLGQKLAEKFKSNVVALITYANNLRKFYDPIDRKKALDSLDVYIRSVLDESFTTSRYATEHSEHLRDVFASRPGLKELWVENQEVDLSISLGPEFRGWRCENADHFEDLLLCGTVVRNSCQNVNGELSNNKCLLAYLLDGKIRLFSIKDENGKIIARSICRLLWDAKKEQPALMMEKMYWKGEPDLKLKESLIEFVKLQAARLRVPVFEDTHTYSNPEPSMLKSKGGRAPWEYVDSAECVHEESRYEIIRARMIYDPTEVIPLSSQS